MIRFVMLFYPHVRYVMKIARLIAPILLLVLFSDSASADHIAGGELLYEHVSGNTYRISLTLYGECSGGSFPHLKIGQPRIKALNENGRFFTLILKEELNKRAEVTNVCPAEAGNTSCQSSQGYIPGITRFVYSATTELEPAEKWRFLFLGQLDTSGKSQTGLNTYISNLKNNTGFTPHLYLEATLNNKKSPNSTPQYTVVPTPRYCINQPHQYNQGAIDDDHDALRFSLVPPLAINGIETEYVPPYTARQPFAVQSGSFSYNALTGQMSFVPVKVEVAFIVNKVEEYRDGELVGSSMRGMTFFMLSNCNNAAPFGNVDPVSVVGGGMLHENTVNLCDDAEGVELKIPARDNNSDNINVTLSNIPAGATAFVSNNGGKAPVIHFEWSTGAVAPGAYTFYARYDDGACPMPGSQTMAYTVRIAAPFTIFHEVAEHTNCLYRQQVIFHTGGGILPRWVRVTDAANNLVREYNDSTGTIRDSFRTGSYKVLLFADNLPCSTQYSFTVEDYGTYPFPPQFEDIHHCLYEPVQELKVSPSPGGLVQWYDIQGNRLSEPPGYATSVLFHYQWPVNQKVKSCESVFDTFDVFVHDYPAIRVGTEGGHACVGDAIYLYASGGVRYEWQPADKITYRDGQPVAGIYGPQVFVVTGYSEYDCASTDTLVFDEIEACCLFSYPNAFTPNDDGNNDGWHPITYGNVDYYLLSVYDRWGQRIFITSDPKEKWDGNHLGQHCDVGTYHYFLRAKCVTGQEEKNSGSFILLR